MLKRTERTSRIDWAVMLQHACRLIESGSPKLEDVATTIGVNRSELQRQFTRRLGVSPKAYAQTLALHRLARSAKAGRSALDAVFEAGYVSSSTGYAAAAENFGATPGALRRALDVGWWMGLSDLGWMLLGATSGGICWLTFGDQPGAMLEELRTAFPKARLYNDEARLYRWFLQVRDFVLLPRASLDLPLDIQGTAFQSRVWRALKEIPLGDTVSYSALASRIGSPLAARAVASACGRNHIALLIPCHRAVGSDGDLVGYRWGVPRKQALLAREATEHAHSHANAR